MCTWKRWSDLDEVTELGWRGEPDRSSSRIRFVGQQRGITRSFMDDHLGSGTSRTRIVKHWDSTWSALCHLPWWASAQRGFSGIPSPCPPHFCSPRSTPSAPEQISPCWGDSCSNALGWAPCLLPLDSWAPNRAYIRAQIWLQRDGKADIIYPACLKSNFHQKMNKTWSLCIDSKAFSPQPNLRRMNWAFSWCPVSPFKIITWLSRLSWLYHCPHGPGSSQMTSGCKETASQIFYPPYTARLFFFFKVPLLFIEISQSYYYWHHSATADVFGAWGGGAVREHTLTETNLWKMYLIHTNSPGKKKISQQRFSSGCSQTLTTIVHNTTSVCWNSWFSQVETEAWVTRMNSTLKGTFFFLL